MTYFKSTYDYDWLQSLSTIAADRIDITKLDRINFLLIQPIGRGEQRRWFASSRDVCAHFGMGRLGPQTAHVGHRASTVRGFHFRFLPGLTLFLYFLKILTQYIHHLIELLTTSIRMNRRNNKPCIRCLVSHQQQIQSVKLDEMVACSQWQRKTDEDENLIRVFDLKIAIMIIESFSEWRICVLRIRGVVRTKLFFITTRICSISRFECLSSCSTVVHWATKVLIVAASPIWLH